jgi:hypothetical protein
MSTPPPRVRDAIEEMGEARPYSETMSLNRVRRSLTITLMKDAWRDTDHTLESPGEVEQWWFPEKGIVAIDLDGGCERD